MRFAPLSPASLKFYWEKLKEFPTLFNRHIQGLDDFIATFISQDSNGDVKANGIMWQVDDVGILWLTDIYADYQATAHFTFWDRRFRGREGLIQEMLRHIFEEYSFHRIITEVPLYTPATLAAVERVGFKKEGRLRKAAWYRDAWWDVNLYGVLREDIDDGLPKAENRNEAAEVAGNTARG